MITRMERPTATMAFFLPRRRASASVAGAEEGVGLAGADGGLAEDPGEVAVAVPGRAVAFGLAGGGVDRRARTSPRRPDAPAVGNRVMSRPISAMMIAAAVGPMPGISSSRVDRVSERGRCCLDLGVDGGDVGVDGVDPGQHPGQQER